MILQQIFFNSVGRLRSGWRVLLYAFIFVSLYFLFGTAIWIVTGLLGPVSPRIPHPAFFLDLVGRFILLAGALIAGWFCNRYLEGLPWRALGLALHSGWMRDLLVGSIVGIVSLFLAVGLATLGGGIKFSVNSALGTVALSLIGTLVLFVVAALAEEAIFRGYGLQTLTRAQLAWVGILLTSVPFAMGHLWNPNVVPIITFANTVIAGAWLAISYLRTRSLWFPLGVHWAWNWALGSICGLPVSGLKIGTPLLNATDAGPAWLTGGRYGIEGGVAASIALVVSILFVWKTRLVCASPELLAMTSAENPAVPPAVLSIRNANEHTPDVC
jgi:membrane protease YdiL (CAAX protease family)